MTGEPHALVVVAVGGADRNDRAVHEGRRLADALGYPWEAIYVETPDTQPSEDENAGSVLAVAARLGATIATIPASDVAAGLDAHLEASPADYLVIGCPRTTGGMIRRRRSLLDHWRGRPDAPKLILVGMDDPGTAKGTGPFFTPGFSGSASWRAYGLSVLMVVITLLVALALRRFAGARTLDLLFLFPVITAAARSGLRPSLAAAAASVVAYNYFLVEPHYTLGLKSPQSIVMAGVLVLIAGYTSFLTARLRNRMRLSDRSAAENARIAAFGKTLATAADWESTAQIICEEATALLDVQSAVLREKDGLLEVAGAHPTQPTFSPVDQAALDWTWANGAPAGSGTDVLSAADWQFQPLSTSLGRLAVLAIARHDGRNPVRAHQATLLATVVAQAALAHERLRLEDQMRVGNGPD